LVLELLDCEIDGGEPVRSGDLAAHVMTVADEGDLAHLLVGHPSGVLLGEVDLSSIHALEKAPEPSDLVDGALTEQIGDLGVAAADGDLHSAPPFVRGRSTEVTRSERRPYRRGRAQWDARPRPT